MRHAIAVRLTGSQVAGVQGLLGQTMPGHERLWKISELFCIFHFFFHSKKLLNSWLLMFFCHEVLLWTCEEEKPESAGLQGYNSLSPLPLNPNYATLQTFQEGIVCNRMEEAEIVYYSNILCFNYSFCSSLDVFPRAPFRPLFWQILQWQADDMWVEKVNE